MMLELTNHKINPANDRLRVQVMDAPGAGGAYHHYRIDGYTPQVGRPEVTEIVFQNGPIAEVGVNGITHEALLAILIDRLERFQRGRFACEENGEALAHLQGAAAALHRRTRGRMARLVEGTHEP